MKTSPTVDTTADAPVAIDDVADLGDLNATSGLTGLAAPAEAPWGMTDERASLDTMLIALIASKGSDLHLTVGAPPSIRIHGALATLPDYDRMKPRDTQALLKAAATPDQWRQFEATHELDFAYSIAGLSRFRV
ncbi:MAG: twitching motility protein PilT, partial [Micromonosporaceae bacterium]|nr:twitching motility protein PilT [Micromonosporaceae bacterium]